MSVNSYLESLAGQLVIRESERESISTSLSTIESRLKSYFGYSELEETVRFGSFARRTILPRKADSKSDVDLMVVFDNSSDYRPQTYLDRLKRFAEHYYSRSDIKQSSPSIVLELNHISFDLVPAYRSGSSYYIPLSATDWQWTDPNGFNATLDSGNKDSGYKLKRVIRLLKHWNIQKNYRDISSYELEKKVAEELRFAYITCTSYTDYLRRGLEAIKYITDYSRVSKAISTIDDALRYERDGMPYTAESEIKKVFPEL